MKVILCTSRCPGRSGGLGRGRGWGGGGDSQVNMFVIKLLPGANISNVVSVCMVGLKFVFSEKS